MVRFTVWRGYEPLLRAHFVQFCSTASLRALSATERGWRAFAQEELTRRRASTRIVGVVVDDVPLDLVAGGVRFDGNVVEAFARTEQALSFKQRVRFELRSALGPAVLMWEGVVLPHAMEDAWGGSVVWTDRTLRLRCVVGDDTGAALCRAANQVGPALAMCWCFGGGARLLAFLAATAWLCERLGDDPSSPYKRVVLRPLTDRERYQ